MITLESYLYADHREKQSRRTFIIYAHVVVSRKPRRRGFLETTTWLFSSVVFLGKQRRRAVPRVIQYFR